MIPQEKDRLSSEDLNTQFGELISSGHIRFRRVLPGSVERVWAYLTEEEKCAQWLGRFKGDLQVGSSVSLSFDLESLASGKSSSSGVGADVTGEITQCVPPHKLSYTWCWGDHVSEVSFELTAQEEGVLLVLDHKRLTAHDHLISVATGWHAHLGLMLDKLGDRQSAPFWETHDKLKGEYRDLLETL